MNSVYLSKSRNLSRRKQTLLVQSSEAPFHPSSKENYPSMNRIKEQTKKCENKQQGTASNSRYSSNGKTNKNCRKSKDKQKMISAGHTPMHFSSTISAFHCTPRNSRMPSPCKNISDKEMSKQAFRFLQKIGSGGFGQVWKVEFKKNSRPYAMKQISKSKVILKKSVQSILNQKEILCSLYSPFIVNMKCSFQDRDNLYLLLDYLTGGDLRYHLCSKPSFSQEQSKFMISCIILSLEYIHDNNIIHRDLKPENLVFENTGYLRVTDFGIARKRRDKNANETSGTPGYMSPQVICRMNHSFEADYFALGVIAFEFMLRRRPYVGNSRKQIREHMLSKQVLVSKYEVPKGWSLQSADFVNKLIQRKKEARLGYGGISEIKKHPWLASVNWEKLKNKQVRPSFSPRNLCETIEYLREIDFTDASNVTNDQQQKILLRNNEIQCTVCIYSELFQSYNEIGAFKMYYSSDSTKSTFYTYCQYEDK